MLQGAPEFDLEEQEEIGLSPSSSNDTIDRTSISRLSSPTSVISIMAEVLRDQIQRIAKVMELVQAGKPFALIPHGPHGQSDDK